LSFTNSPKDHIVLNMLVIPSNFYSTNDIIV
jgi:hypothetical protein